MHLSWFAVPFSQVTEHANHESLHFNPVLDLAQMDRDLCIVAGAMAPGIGFWRFDTSGKSAALVHPRQSTPAARKPGPRVFAFFAKIITSTETEGRMTAAACLIALAIGGLLLVLISEVFQ